MEVIKSSRQVNGRRKKWTQGKDGHATASRVHSVEKDIQGKVNSHLGKELGQK
ncbi:Hypothetical predicted protein, partial [Marmota monax]